VSTCGQKKSKQNKKNVGKIKKNVKNVKKREKNLKKTQENVLHLCLKPCTFDGCTMTDLYFTSLDKSKGDFFSSVNLRLNQAAAKISRSQVLAVEASPHNLLSVGAIAPAPIDPI